MCTYDIWKVKHKYIGILVSHRALQLYQTVKDKLEIVFNALNSLIPLKRFLRNDISGAKLRITCNDSNKDMHRRHPTLRHFLRVQEHLGLYQVQWTKKLYKTAQTFRPFVDGKNYTQLLHSRIYNRRNRNVMSLAGLRFQQVS